MNFFSRFVAPYAKAHIAGWGTALSMIGADWASGPVSVAQYEAAALVALGIGGGVALAKNRVIAAGQVAVAVAQDVAPKAVAVVAQDVTQLIPVVQAAVAAVDPAVAPAVQQIVADVQAIAQSVAPAPVPTPVVPANIAAVAPAPVVLG